MFGGEIAPGAVVAVDFGKYFHAFNLDWLPFFVTFFHFHFVDLIEVFLVFFGFLFGVDGKVFGELIEKFVVGLEWVDDLLRFPEEHFVGEGLVVDEDGHGVEDFVLDAFADDGDFFGQFAQDIDDELGEEDDVAVLLFVIFEFLEQLVRSLIDVGGEGLEQLASVGREFFNLLDALNVLFELLAEGCVEGHALFNEAFGHLIEWFDLI